MQAAFSFNMRGPRPENVRQQNPAAGGGIMDVGCYCASMSRLIAGAAAGGGPAEASEVKAVGYVNPQNRVDEWSSAVVRFPGDVLAELTCGIQVGVQSAVRVWGSDGHIVVGTPWFPGQGAEAKIVLQRNGQDAPEEIPVPSEIPLYSVEADTVARCVAEGRQQAPYPCMTWDDTLANMRLLDSWREQIGLQFDNETAEGLRLPFAGRPLRREPNVPMRYGQVEGWASPCLASSWAAWSSAPAACAWPAPCSTRSMRPVAVPSTPPTSTGQKSRWASGWRCAACAMRWPS